MYGEDSSDMSFLCYRGSVRRGEDMRGEIEAGVVIHGRIGLLGYLCLFIRLSLPLVCGV